MWYTKTANIIFFDLNRFQKIVEKNEFSKPTKYYGKTNGENSTRPSNSHGFAVRLTDLIRISRSHEMVNISHDK